MSILVCQKWGDVSCVHRRSDTMWWFVSSILSESSSGVVAENQVCTDFLKGNRVVLMGEALHD